MITVYLKKEDPVSADIVDRLRELVVAHRVVYLDENSPAKFPGGPLDVTPGENPEAAAAGRFPGASPETSAAGRIKPPALVDDDTVVRGGKKIFAHLQMLELFLGEWSKFQSDACYCDRDGNVE